MHRKAHQKQPSPPYPFAVLCISLVLCFQPHARSRTRNACSASSREPTASTTAGLLPAASTGSSSSSSAAARCPCLLLLRRRSLLRLIPGSPDLHVGPHRQEQLSRATGATSPAGAGQASGGSREAGAPSQAEPPRRTCGSGRLRAGAAVCARLGVRLPPRPGDGPRLGISRAESRLGECLAEQGFGGA